MTRRNEERLLQQLADDVARLTDERDALAKRLAEAEARAAYWCGVAVERQQLLNLAASRRKPRAVQLDQIAPHAAPLMAGPTLGLPGDDATVGQEAAA